MAVAGVCTAGVALADDEDAPNEADAGWHLLPLATRQRIFFKYEKRVRDKSTLDKVFEYFCSQEKDRHKYMLPVDLLRAIVPTYPPSESQMDRSGSLDGERASAKARPFWTKAQTSFFQEFDTDGDGLLSYPEFLLLVTLLSIPQRDVHTIFDVVDLDGNGFIDAEEFKVVMRLLQSKANVHASKVGRSHRLSTDGESGILVSFFGPDGSKRLSRAAFAAFLDRLHTEVLRLEYAHYDCRRRGSIPGLDFGRSLVAGADVRHVDRLLDKVDALDPALARRRVSWEDFAAVAALAAQLPTLGVALDFFMQVERPVTKPDLAKLLTRLLGITLSPHVLDILFAVFADDRGHLDTPVFLDMMRRREVLWGRRQKAAAEAGGQPRRGSLGAAWACVRRCAAGEE